VTAPRPTERARALPTAEREAQIQRRLDHVAPLARKHRLRVTIETVGGGRDWRMVLEPGEPVDQAPKELDV